VATYRIVAWRDIPATVEAFDGRDSVSHPLSDRFQQLIDSVATQLGLHEQDAYLDHWAKGEPRERPGTAAEVAGAVAQELEDRFTEFIARAYGRPPGPGPS
jgi:hypothetical protein